MSIIRTSYRVINKRSAFKERACKLGTLSLLPKIQKGWTFTGLLSIIRNSYRALNKRAAPNERAGKLGTLNDTAGVGSHGALTVAL